MSNTCNASQRFLMAHPWLQEIHFRTADAQGYVIGRKVAQELEKHYYQPVGCLAADGVDDTKRASVAQPGAVVPSVHECLLPRRGRSWTDVTTSRVVWPLEGWYLPIGPSQQ